MTDSADRIVWEADEEALYRHGRGRAATESDAGAREAPRDAHTVPDAATGDSAATITALRAEVERLRASTVEASNTYAQWRDDLAAEYRKAGETWDRQRERLNGEIERLRGWIDRAEAAEAKVAAVEALADYGPVYEGETEDAPYVVRLEDLRAARASVGRTEPAPEAGTCGCGSPDAYSLNPSEAIVHCVDGRPCYIASVGDDGLTDAERNRLAAPESGEGR